eukprot:TRINITY_DN626_c0_g1_i1.p1 TRINITY_DN626_c0_g1~~TRINITY_DN626_c0_g1_i1.p1  ORF type:complete len:515 (-),score=140.28 TRINITY_DN626_c0_g1_i1:48-1592(-)
MSSLVRKYYRTAKNAWNNYSEVQVWVREATSNDPWGPSSSLMLRIAREAESPANYHMMFTALWKRLTDYQHIKHVLKALVLIDYLLKHCHERFVADVRLRADVIRRLKNYKYFEDGRDIGAEVRHKAQAVMALLENRDLLEKERQIARETEGKIKGYSNEYAAYDDRADPFGAVSGNDERLQLEYYRDDSDQHNREEDHKSEVEDQDSSEERPKVVKKSSKKGKKGKKRRSSKKNSAAPQEAEQEREDEVEIDNNNPPNYGVQKDFFDETDEDEVDQNKPPVVARPKKAASSKPLQMDDFLSEIGNSKPMLFETDLVTGGYNSAAAAQFGWLAPANTQPVTNDELALFDIVPEKKPQADAKPVVDRAKTSQPDGFLFDFGEKHEPVTPFDEELKREPAAPVDPWDVAKEISLLDNLHETVEERQIKQNLQDKRERMRNGPKLKDLQKSAKQEQANVNPFDALVQGAPSADYTGQSIALVPAGNFQALVPAGYGYGYPPTMTYPPMHYDPYYRPY